MEEETTPTKKKILLVDDDRTTVILLKTMLTREGYDIIEAENGEEAYQITKRMSPALAIIDVKMPTMGGVTYYQCICDSQGKTRFPVIVLTGSPGELKLHRDINFREVIAKPFEIERVMETVQRLIGHADSV